MSAHCLNHALTASPMTEEESRAYLAQCWEELTVEKVPVAWSSLLNLLETAEEGLWQDKSESIARLLANEVEVLKEPRKAVESS